MAWFRSDKECAQCVQHAQMHSGNWLGLGSANDPCPPCEDHAANGCGLNRTARPERNPA